MIVNFTEICSIVREGIKELIRYHDCIRWQDFGDKGERNGKVLFCW